ncbi:MAG: YjbQ family protein [Actinobacteria bacterium]|nr:YjbQ family protein [Actinomycetota bacterium]
MKILTKESKVKTKGWIDLIDLTTSVNDIIKESKIEDGSVLVYSNDEKTAIIGLEAEKRLVFDTADFIGNLVSMIKEEDRGAVAASILGGSFLIPVTNGSPDLGTWQQVFLVDLGKSGEKSVIFQVIGKRREM